MKFTIDTDEIKKLGIPKEVFFHVLPLYFRCYNTEEHLQKADGLGLITRTLQGDVISDKGINLIQDVFIKSANPNTKSYAEYKDIAEALVSLYPEGIKPGTGTFWRGSIPYVAQKLKILEYKADIQIQKEKAIEATRNYIKLFEDKQLMQTLPYFIYKTHRNADGSVEWTSNFLSALEALTLVLRFYNRKV